MTSLIYGCPESVITATGDISNDPCLSPYASLAPLLGLTDAAGCTNAYSFMAQEGICAAKTLSCVDLAAWTSDASSGLSLCVAQFAASTDAPATNTATSGSGQITSAPSNTGTGSVAKSATSTGAVATNTKSSAGVNVKRVGGMALIGTMALMVLNAGM